MNAAIIFANFPAKTLFEDGGLLYVPESGKVCVFGTSTDILNFGDDAGNCGIEDALLESDCFDDLNLDSIYKIPTCTEI